ncbi:hypothetical protein [Ruminococcus sp.]|uniref:hypothetical protein n=1 Tax=Ruminococcus sp. TaxID=41978 RepID=UPI00386B0A88
METTLCKVCGRKLNPSDKVCPDCGTLNPNNDEVAQIETEKYTKQIKSINTYHCTVLMVTLLISVGLDIVDFSMLFNDKNSISFYLLIGLFFSGMGTVLSIIGIFKKENVNKLVYASIFVSIIMLLINCI